MLVTDLAYVAGVIDSDGTIGVRKTDYGKRVRKDCTQHIYFERICVRQVETGAVDFLHSIFPATRGILKPSLENGRPLHYWLATCKVANRVLLEVLPFLKIKTEQAKNAIELRKAMSTPKRWVVPKIIDGEPLISAKTFALQANKKPEIILQATSHGTIPSCKIGRNRMIPASFLPVYLERGNRGPRRSQEVTDMLELCFQKSKKLNRVGIAVLEDL